MNKLRAILLAEDSPQDVEMTLVALGDHNLANEIVVVSDGEDTLDYLYRRGKHAARPPGNPALVLLDLKMPKVDGLEVLRTIKQDEALRAIPIVMLTSSREEQDVVASYRLGVNAYVVKPVEVAGVPRGGMCLGVNAYVVKPVGFQAFVQAVKGIGTFWALLNEPAPDHAGHAAGPGS